MNNKYYLFLSIILSIYAVFSIPVSASDSIPVYDMVEDSDLISNEFDSAGHVISGSVFYSYSNSSDVPNIQTCFNFFMPNQNGSLKCIYCLLDSNKSVYRDKYTFMFVFNSGYNSYRNYQKWYTYNEISQAYQNDDVSSLLSETVSSNNYTDPRTGSFGTDNEIVTNIPIFNYDDTIHVNSYINDGSLDGCINMNNVIPPPEIPYPTNITLSKTSKQNYGDRYNNPIVVSWNAGINANYNYQNMRFSVSYEAIYGYSKAGISNTVSSGVKNVAQHVKYQNENQTYTIGTDTLNENLTLTIAGLEFSVKSKWLNSITIYIQNEDDQNSNYASSIKYVAYDFVTKVEDSSNPPIDDGSLGGGESDGNTSGVGDGSSGGSHSSGSVSLTNNNNPNITINNSNNLTGGATDNYITSAVQGALNGTSAMGSAIHNGFGILGENGFLSAMTSMFTFIPQDIISMITTTVGACCLMFIVGAVVWFIRG